MRTLLRASGIAIALAGACANDPVYISGPVDLVPEVDAMGGIVPATASLTIPIKVETMEDAMARAARAAALGVDVPYVRIGDLEISVEWTITNTSERDGTAVIQLNGANELWAYDPTLVSLGDDDETPPAPGLAGDIPLRVAAGASLSGVFREDQVREASVDLDQITRGNMNPFTATLQVHKHATAFQPMTPPMPDDPDYVQTPTGPAIPREAFAQIVRLDLVFTPSQPMTMTYAVRVRDVRGILPKHMVVDEAGVPVEMDEDEPLAVFAPAEYAVGAM